MSGQPWRDSLRLLIASLCSQFHQRFLPSPSTRCLFVFFPFFGVLFFFRLPILTPPCHPIPLLPPFLPPCHHPSLHFPVMSGPAAPCLLLSVCRGDATPPPLCISLPPVFLASMSFSLHPPSFKPSFHLPACLPVYALQDEALIDGRTDGRTKGCGGGRRKRERKEGRGREE